MTSSMTLTASLEDYLEAIFHIIEEKQVARPKDIAKKLKVSYASVTGALRALADKKMIHYNPYDVVTLTVDGQTAAKDVIRRHEVLRDFFVKVLAVDDKEADEAACLMEHSIPMGILERFVQFVEFVEVCPRGGSKWIAGFGYHCDQGATQENCDNCITTALEAFRRRAEQGGKKVKTSVKMKDLKPGQKGKVLKISAQGATNKRLVEMGVTVGSVVEVERVAPLGDPVDIKVKGYHLSLRKNESEGIEIELL